MAPATPIIRVPAFSIPFSKKQLSDTLTLNQFQAEVYDLVNRGKDVVLTAPTGAGKTLTLLLNTEKGVTIPRNHKLRGFIALYPNNTLLLNQICTVEEILVEHLGAEIKDAKDSSQGKLCEAGRIIRKENPLRVYKVDTSRAGNAWAGSRYVVLLALSGRYITSPNGEPKREVIEHLVEEIYNRYARKEDTYLMVFATPDTYLLVSTGAYRDFNKVGKTLHNILVALAEGKTLEEIDNILRITQVMIREEVGSIATAQRLFQLPLFIDEFHLYGPYEIDALVAILKLYKEYMNGENPVVFSSATPAEDILEEIKPHLQLNPASVKAKLVGGGKGFPVRGDTEFILLPVEDAGKGYSAYFRASDRVPSIVENDLLAELRALRDGKALIILDRLWMVSVLARGLSSKGLKVDCIASIIPPEGCSPGSSIIVGSEATTQGVNLGRVVLGVTAGTSSEDVVQRIGRIGRRGVDSKVYLVLPAYALEENPPRGRMGYYELVDWVRRVYPDYPKRKRDVAKLLPEKFRKMRRKLIYFLGIASLIRTSGASVLGDGLESLRQDAQSLLGAYAGPPRSLAKLLMFRRTGFTAAYRIDWGKGGEAYQARGEASIGLLVRNFKIERIDNEGTLHISLEPERSTLKVIVEKDPSPFSGRIVELRLLMKLLSGRISIGDRITLEAPQAKDTLVYLGDFGGEVSEYLSYTGEGAEISAPKGSRYAVVFI